MSYYSPSHDRTDEPKEERAEHKADAQRSPASRGESPGAPPTAPTTSPSAAYHEAITFRDAGGTLWWVHEVSGEALGSSRPCCLLLVSGTQLRRIWTYPSDWRSRTPDELLALSENSV
jgi:hypothetical protein